ncbi:esterase [Hymenobacter qilianensis]|uniref:Esterase n=2 Tax=Hymenobacter qilianensis TaxID=1385715 RepID=A0ACB5PQW8_9BACT|nr:phospholipase [Hymenobacter qilianensis]QNP51954.1 phospholipase [Hymenobacter qilianensis]GGF63188.1 esterase [Hymenobacter qilianensis]
MASAQEHRLTVARTARYYQLGELTERTRYIWFVCHGYGQLAAYFIRHFAVLTEVNDTVIIAPESLSRFYLQGNGGRIGASWMTREDRLAEIDDYVTYLNHLAETLLQKSPPDVAITVFGFSQGAATVSRWLARATFRPDRLILWAGAFPDDIDFAVATHLLQRLPVVLVCGDQDEFIKEADLQKQRDFLVRLGVEPIILRFTGKHELNAATLRQLM